MVAEEKRKIWLEKLKEGVLWSLHKQELREPAYHAIGFHTDKSARWSKIYEYTSDIQRIRQEMLMCIALVGSLPSGEYLLERRISSEDYLNYHQGYFLELVHQMKDKICRLIDALSKPGKYTEPPRLKIKTIAASPAVSKIRNVPELLETWNQETSGGVARCLEVRRDYHHFRNRIPLNDDYLRLKSLRSLKDSGLEARLNDTGRAAVAKRASESLESLQANILNKISSTQQIVEQNTEELSRALCRYYKLPYHTRATHLGLRFVREIQEEEKWEQISLSSVADPGPYRPILETAKMLVASTLGLGKVASFYLVGSVARGNAVPFISDINFVLIVKNPDQKQEAQIISEIVQRVARKNYQGGLRVDMLVLCVSELNAPENFKTRFICKTDGILLFGDPIGQKEKMPRPSIGLAYLLNKDFRTKVATWQKRVIDENPMSQDEVNEIVMSYSKDALRLIFGEVMANETIYAKTIQDMKRYANLVHQENWRPNCRLYFLATGTAYTNKNGLQTLLDSAIESLFPLLDQIEAGATKWFENWTKEQGGASVAGNTAALL